MVRLGTRWSLVIFLRSAQLRTRENASASFHNWLDDGTALHPSMEEKGMTTMRLHRLHFSSKLWSRTFAMSWPHSQRVSEASALARNDEPVVIKTRFAFLDIENNY